MDVDKVPETKASRAFRIFFEKRGEARGEAQGEANGRRKSLFRVLAARGLSPSKDERASITTLTDVAVLDRCIEVAVTAPSVAAVLASAEAQGEANGRRESLLRVLAARGLSPTKEERASLTALTDVAVLDRCVEVAVTAPSVAAVLASAETSHRRRAAPARAAKRRAVKKPSSRR